MTRVALYLDASDVAAAGRAEFVSFDILEILSKEIAEAEPGTLVLIVSGRDALLNRVEEAEYLRGSAIAEMGFLLGSIFALALVDALSGAGLASYVVSDVGVDGLVSEF